MENKTLGKKLDEVRDVFSQNPKYFVKTETLEYITRLITSVRNDIAHPSSENSYSKDIIAIQSRLSSQLAFAFIQFTTKTLSSFLDKNGQLVNVQILETPADKNQTIFYFGFDGDSTDYYLEMAFEKSNEDEVRQRSQILHEVIGELKKLIYKATKDNKSVLFAEGDNILFKASYQAISFLCNNALNNCCSDLIKRTILIFDIKCNFMDKWYKFTKQFTENLQRENWINWHYRICSLMDN
ncbi:MAG: hypothetical protein F6K23_07495 [Okeania sp. SIO2C9]|uniref:hypothetical protein n=1 Tax=Okeania sp. SIO2C9 TaxID=2607791 RepID=UPI0013C114E0|nr:hypothetical protein [Okeania sp. SIO2C9]NEQ72928.1 hypothetical protein [Okeania sp. SIO2C9]